LSPEPELKINDKQAVISIFTSGPTEDRLAARWECDAESLLKKMRFVVPMLFVELADVAWTMKDNFVIWKQWDAVAEKNDAVRDKTPKAEARAKKSSDDDFDEDDDEDEEAEDKEDL